jgi:hypothetical protein
MQKAIFILIIFLMSLLLAVLCNGESLKIIDEMTMPVDEAAYSGNKHGRLQISGVLLEGDNAFAAAKSGVLAKFPDEQSWREILDCEPYGNNWWEDYEKAKKQNALFAPWSLWRIAGIRELVVFDAYLGCLYSINQENRNNVTAKLWKNSGEKFSIFTVAVYDGLILYSLGSGYHDTILAVSGPDTSNFHMVFECPSALKHKFDSLWADPCCHPAFNPIDSTIWLAFVFYDYIYVIDFNGKLLDSVALDASDFRLPQPPRSRMHSDAVFQDWYSRCTPVESFWYVPPDYFLLQFRSGWRKIEADSIQLRTTLAWTADRQPVGLTVEKDWHLVGVQLDGRVIFAHYVIEDNEFKEIVLHIARIEP